MARRLSVRVLTLVATVVAALAVGATGASAAESDSPIHLAFQKTCQGLDCTGYLLNEDGAPLPRSSVTAHLVVTGVTDNGQVYHLTAVETISYRRSSVTVNWTGIADHRQVPTLILMHGVVASGTGRGRRLVGANTQVTAQSVAGVVTGVITIVPADELRGDEHVGSTDLAA